MFTSIFIILEQFVKDCINQISIYKWWRYYSKGITLKKLTKEQKEQIQNYYRPLTGKKVDVKWHALLYSLTGVFNVKYLPFDLFHKIAYSLSPWEYHKILDDKNMYRQLFHGFNLPERIVECSCGVYYLPQEGEKEVTFEEVVNYCQNLEECIIKPSRDSSGGQGVAVLSVKRGITNNGQNIIDIIRHYGNNFLIERKLENCKILNKLNPTSRNTFRILTYRNITGKPQYLKAFLRIGRLGGVIDNASAGGIVCPISPEGVLSKYACTTFPYKEFETTDNGTTVGGYYIKMFPQLIQTALDAHARLPFFNLIGWDITIDKDDRIVIVECNPPCDMRIGQVMFKTSYISEYQEEILERVFKNKKR